MVNELGIGEQGPMLVRNGQRRPAIFMSAEKQGSVVRVGIVDDDALFRAGASKVITDSGSLDLAFAVGMLQESCTQTDSADVILLGNNEGQWRTALAGGGVGDQRPRFIMMIDDPSEGDLASYWDSGIALCLRRETDGQILIKAILRANEMPVIVTSHRVASPAGMGNTVQATGYSGNGNSTDFEALNSREIEILDAIAKGFSNKTIGSHFGISDQTVKNRLTGILRKLQATDRTEAVVIAVRHGWLDVARFGAGETLDEVADFETVSSSGA